jgi:hypothetical protein
MLDWINNTGRIYWHDQYANNEQETAFSKYDPERIADELAGIGADVVAVYATNQFGIAYYPSDIWPMHPGLKGRDYFGEVSAALKKRGVRVIAYTNWLDSKRAEWNMIPLGQENNPYFKEQPLASWAKSDVPGMRVQDLPGGAWRSPCFNSPHREEFVAIAREIADRYHPDLYHLDMTINSGVCVCEFCRPTLERICGSKEITEQALRAHWREFVDWRCESSARILREMTAVLHERGVGTAHNAFDPILMAAANGLDESWMDTIDVYLSECFDAFFVRYADLNSGGIICRLHHGLGKPSWILRTSHPAHYAHTSISEAHWRVAAASAKSNGCKVFGPCGVGAKPDTTTSSRLLRNVELGYDLFMDDADLRECAVSAAKVGLVFSWATRKYDTPDSIGGFGPLNWAADFNGWARTLIEEHVPFDVIVAESRFLDCARNDNGCAAELAKYDLVILPGVTCASESFCSAIRDYVASGGRILATGDTSLFDEKGSQRPDCALADVLGASLVERISGPFAIQRPEEPEPACGDFFRVKSAGKVRMRRIETDPAGGVGGGEDPLPVGEPTWPFFTVHDHGKGQAAYVAFDIGRFFTAHGDTHTGELMAEILDAILPERQIAVKAPVSVEVTLWEQPGCNRTIIHIANRSVQYTLPTGTREIREIVPVHGIEISLPSPAADPSVTARHTDVTSAVADGRLIMTLGRVDDYAAVIVAT